MKKTLNIIFWVVVLALLLAAAYTFYGKNKAKVVNPSLTQNTTTQASTAAKSSQAGEVTAPDGTNKAVDTSTPDDKSKEATTTSEKIAAPDFTLKDLDGNEVKLSDYKGKIVFLNFWAVWCKYCKLEMPDLNEFSKELEKEKDAVILAVDVQESQDAVRNYLTSNKYTLKVLMDEDGAVSKTYGIEGFPTTFVIDKDGSLYTYLSGETDLATLKKILNKIRNGESPQ